MSVNRDKRLGMLTPSSNTVLEPATSAMLQGISGVSAHFSRFQVLKISLQKDALSQFTMQPMLIAAQLLDDAKMDVICWNGTSSGWLGFDTDEKLCLQIEHHTTAKACSSVLALNEILRKQKHQKIAFVTPYLNEIQSAIIKNYENNGFSVVAEKHLDDWGNFSFSTYTEDHIADMCGQVATQKPDAICIFCTNFRGASIAAKVEQDTGIPVYDTVSTSLWKSLQMVGVSPSVVKGWGSIFDVS